MSKAVHSIANESNEDGNGEGDFPINKAVVKALLEGSNSVSSTRHGISNWTITVRLNVLLPDGVAKTYFLKVATDETTRVMVEGEFNSMTSLYETSPDFVPKPVTWSKFERTRRQISPCSVPNLQNSINRACPQQ
ncbi:hypothetical protein G6011_09584 [Alternaria panax]|uniref:Uncharacterized protein n=1 Tax=Alternaria panax TaxID=48097 RepID=A0AAD4I7D1_9PLEO|nr:hypothetical protein G6011_09584 [Alternaria panax]